MLRIGLTGGIGCGKSTACSFFIQLGIPVIDTDELARTVVEPDSTCLATIVDVFGSHLLHSDGTLDRRKLRELVFSDKKKLEQLEAIIHPAIRELLWQKVSKISAPYVVIAIPLLFEKGWSDDVDRVLVIDCNTENQLQRTVKRDSVKLEDVHKIINNQIDRNQRISSADDVVTNDTSIDDLHTQIESLHLYYIQLAQDTE